MEPKVRFTWNMLYDCNYRCCYCFFEGKWKEYRKRNIYLCPDEWMEHWKRIYDKYGPFYLIVTGGEPFIYPNFIEIIRRLSQICYHINISSNSSGDLRGFAEIIDPKRVSLSLSYQPQFDKLEDFLERVLFLRKYKFDGCLNFVAYPPYLKDIEYYKDRFNSIGEVLKIIPFFGEYQSVIYPQGYAEEERRLIEIDENWFKKIRKKGLLCPAGQRTALIFPDGKVARCGQIGEDMILGNFFDSSFKLLDNPLPCEAEFCPCDEEEVIPENNRDKAAIKVLEKKPEVESAIKPEEVKRGIYFTWDIHYKCNFRCPYCWFYKGWAEGAKRNIYLSLEEWMEHWMRIYNRYGQVHIEITGGEPFIYPNFIELVKLLSSIHTIKITTNMSGDIETFVKEIGPERVNLDLNFHPLFANIEIFIKKTLLLKEAGFKAGVCYLAYPPQMKLIDRFKKRFEEIEVNFALAAFWGEYAGKRYPQSYTQQEIDSIRQFLGDINRIIYHLKGESPKGKLCNAGYKYAVVQADGNVVRCGQIADKFIGNIMDEEFCLFDRPLPCEAEICPCNEYTNIIDESGSFDIGSHEIQDEPVKREKIVLAASEKDKPDEFLLRSPKFPRLDPPYRVYWNWDITYECNYKCSYCIFWKEHKERYPFLEINGWKKIWDGIFEKYGCCHIRFSGGEPFIYPHFLELIAMLSDKHTVDVTTNLSFGADSLLRYVPAGGVTLSASFHPEFIDIDRFLDKVVFLNENGFPASIAFVAYPPHLKDLERYKSAAGKRKVFNQTGVLFKVIPFIGEFEGRKYPEGYSAQQRKLLEAAAINTEIESQKELNVQWLDQGKNEKSVLNKRCRMGQMYAKILPNGDVTRCCHHESGKLGSIFDKDFRLLDGPTPCTIDSCACWKPMIVGYKEDRYPIFWEMPEHKIYKLKKP